MKKKKLSLQNKARLGQMLKTLKVVGLIGILLAGVLLTNSDFGIYILVGQVFHTDGEVLEFKKTTVLAGFIGN